jgi:hypothetical protein
MPLHNIPPQCAKEEWRTGNRQRSSAAEDEDRDWRTETPKDQAKGQNQKKRSRDEEGTGESEQQRRQLGRKEAASMSLTYELPLTLIRQEN